MGGSSYWGQFLSIFPSSPTSSASLQHFYKISVVSEYVHKLNPVQTGRDTCTWRVCKLVPLQATHILGQSMHLAALNMRRGHFSLLALVLLSFLSSGQCAPRGGRGGGGRGGGGGGG